MYDRETNTLWNQFLGVPIVGPLVGSGIKLKVFPVTLTTWGEWLKVHPDTLVLSLDTGVYLPSQYEPEDDERSIYFEYRRNPEPIFPVRDRDDRLDAKDQVLGLTVDGKHMAYPIYVVQERRIIHDSVNGVPLVVLGSALSPEAGAYLTYGSRLSLPADAADGLPDILFDENGGRWLVTPEALVNVSDPTNTLPAIPSSVSFWFGWYSFHPGTDVFVP